MDYVDKFYELLASEDEEGLRKLHIPRSDVFYVRQAIEARTGVKYSLTHIEEAMVAEGMIPDERQ